MNGKIIQITSCVTTNAITLTALTDEGEVYQKLNGNKWVRVSLVVDYSREERER